MRRRGPQDLLSELVDLPRGVVGGLIVDLGEAARTKQYREPWERNLTLWQAVREGLQAAADGRQPTARVERLPSWILAAVRLRLRSHETYWLGDDFITIRTLELIGLADLELDDDYVMSMLTGLVSAWSWDDNIWGDPVGWFRQDPGLINRAYWRAFEIEGEGVVSLRVPSGVRSGTDWRSATRRMIDESMITRGQVIAACTTALDQDFSPAASTWFVRMLNDLDLSDTELADLQPTIRRQLHHQAPAVVTNALAWLKRVDRREQLDDEATAPSLEAVLLSPTKTVAMAGLRLLSNIHARNPSVDVVSTARVGLGHQHTDVQRAAARLLLSAGATDQLSEAADLLEPSIRVELGLPDETVAPPKGDDADAGAGHGIRSAQAPVTTHDVTERLAALLERADDPFELELVLDQLACLGETDLLQPLVKRARSIATANEYHRLEQQLAALVLAATGSPISPSAPEQPWARFLHRRLDEVSRILTGTDAPGPRLATPTEPSGWLDPAEFVDRTRRVDLARRETDLTAALLRLGPENRTAALRSWDQHDSAPGTTFDHLVRHALGAPPTPGVAITHPALWVAASRCRSPLHDDRLLVEHGLAGAGQGRGLDPTITITDNPRWRPDSYDQEKQHLRITYLYACTPASFSRSSRDSWWTKNRAWDVNQPTAAGNVEPQNSWSDASGWVDAPWLSWHGLIWPADAEHLANVAALPVYQSREWTAPDSTTDTILTAIRRHPGRIGATTNAIIAFAMTGGTVETRIHAADAIVDLVTRRRISTGDLAAALVTAAPAAVLTRWHETLQHVTAAGHPDITIAILSIVLPTLPRGQRGLHALLDLLHQELLRARRGVIEPNLREHLSTFAGSSKATRTARAILAIQ